MTENDAKDMDPCFRRALDCAPDTAERAEQALVNAVVDYIEQAFRSPEDADGAASMEVAQDVVTCAEQASRAAETETSVSVSVCDGALGGATETTAERDPLETIMRDISRGCGETLSELPPVADTTVARRETRDELQRLPPPSMLEVLCSIKMYAGAGTRSVYAGAFLPPDDERNKGVRPFPGIYGLMAIQRAVVEYLCLPHLKPDYYVRTHMPFHFALLGPPGCGKRTLVEKACREYGINYACMDNRSYAPGLLGEVIARARERQPCVVYLDHYDEAFALGQTTPFSQEYGYHVMAGHVYSKWDRVWLVFGLTSLPPWDVATDLHDTVRERVARHEDMPHEEMVGFMRHHVRERYRASLDDLVGARPNLGTLASAARGLVPAQVADFFGRVFCRRMQRDHAEDPFAAHRRSPDAEAPLPEWRDFVYCMNTTRPADEPDCVPGYGVPAQYTAIEY